MQTEKLAEKMRAKKMTLDDLAAAAEVDKSTISRILNGQRNCTVGVASRIAKALKLSSKDTMDIFFEKQRA